MMVGLFWLLGTILVYFICKRIYGTYRKIYLTPLLLTPVILIVALTVSGVSFADYNKGAGFLTDLVEPATIALAVMLYKHFDQLKKHAVTVLISTSFGAMIAVLTSIGFSAWFGLSPQIVDSLAPRSATTPIAVAISSHVGGLPTITAVATLFTGLVCMITGPLVVKWCRIRHPIARGVLFGTSSHSSGIAKAMEYDPLSGSIATIAMMVTAFITLGAAPWLLTLMQ
ncbi:MAG: LrgB family protein [Clostridia bacterium]